MSSYHLFDDQQNMPQTALEFRRHGLDKAQLFFSAKTQTMLQLCLATD